LLDCILAHEFSHVQQGYLVDSVQQELIAYQAAAKIAHALDYTVGKQLYDRFLALNPANSKDLDTVLALILDLASGSLPTQTIYKSLPKTQPQGAADTAIAAIRQLSAAGIAGIQALRK
jgi:thioredoxin-like negative regulator of GroEL